MRSSSCFLPTGIADGSPSLADEDQLAIERFDDGNTTGPGLAPGATHCMLYIDAFQKSKGLRVGLVRDGRAPVSRADTTGICVDTRSSGARGNEALRQSDIHSCA